MHLFETAFIAGYMRPDARPSAAVWRKAIENWQLQLVPQKAASGNILGRIFQSIATIRQLRLAKERLTRLCAAFRENPIVALRTTWVAAPAAIAVVVCLIVYFELQGDSPATTREWGNHAEQNLLPPNTVDPIDQSERAAKNSEKKKEHVHFPGATNLWNALANED
jgi:hypothetical protein